MSNSKISALTAATTPVAGTEVLPIVQSGVTKQVSIANLTAGRAVSGASFSASGKLFASTSAGAGGVNIGDRATGSSVFEWYASSGPLYLYSYSEAANVLTYTAGTGLTLNTGNLVQGTAAKGINFTANTPAAGMTSQLLNWYEEGATTVTLAFGGASTGITYSTQQCRYTRIGNRVLIQIGLALSNKGSATGAATITGLPFTSKNVGYGGAMMTVYADNMAGVTGAIFPFLPENSSTIQLKKVDVAGNANVTVANTDFNNTSYLMISGQYLVA